MNKRISKLYLSLYQVGRQRFIITPLSIALLLMVQIAALQTTSLHASSPQPSSLYSSEKIPYHVSTSRDGAELFRGTIAPYQNNEILTENSDASTDAPQTVNSLPEHPRVYVRAADIAEIRARYTHADLAYTRYLLEKQINEESDGWSASGRAEIEIRRGIEARAFLYLINGDTNAGEKSIEMMLDFLRSIDQPYNGSTSRARELYDSMIAAAMVYDWCYDLLSDSERATMIEGMYKLAGLSEYGWPLGGNISYLTSHFSEHASVAILAAGIAIFDEDPELFQIAYDQFVNKLAPSRNGYYPMGKHHQGTHYAVARFFHEVHSTLLFNAIDIPNMYSNKQAKVPYYMLYVRTPSGRFLTEGDVAVVDNVDARIQLITAQIYDDPYLMNDGIRVSDDGDLGTLRDAARTFIFWDPTMAVRPINELPTARYFPSPSGSMVARTGWDLEGGQQSNVAMAVMNVGEYFFGNHAHLDSGHFGFYYKGTLALDSGTYAGNTGQYNSAHSRNYYQRTIAHNSLLIEDPNEPYTLHYGNEVDSRDGGQYRPNRGREWEVIEDMFANGKHAQVLAHELGAGSAPEYTYLKGDLTPGYNAPADYNYPPKVTEVKRSFVFLDLKNDLHPAALIVYDKVTSTNAQFKKRWLLHSVERPAVSGSRVTINRTDNGHNGRLVNDVLWPEADNRIIKRVGGEGKEFFVDGANYPNTPNNPSVESGAWRIEVLPIEDVKTDTFLNIMHVMDASGGPAPLATERLNSEKMVGALISNRAVFFSKDADLIADEFKIAVESDLSLINVLVTDLEPGQWYVYAGNQVRTFTASVDGKSIYFSAAPGSYTLTREQIPPTATNTPQPTATNTPQPTATDTPQPTATNTPQPTATNTPQPTPTNTTQPTPTNTPQPTPTNTPQPTPTNTPQPTATNTPLPAATSTTLPTATNTPQPTATFTQQPTQMPTNTPVATPTPWPTVAIPTATPRPTTGSSANGEPFQETFEGISGIINGVNGWDSFRAYVETIPNQDVYQGLSLSRKNASARRALPIGIESGSRGTLHFRIKRTGDADVSIGLSDTESPTEFLAYEVQVGSQFGLHSQSAPNNFMSRDGNEARNLDNQFVVNEWHCVWLVIDNSANSFKGYLLGGAYSEITPLGINGQTNFNFRNGTNDRLQTFYARTGWSSAKVFIDDIYIMPGEINPTSNTPSCQADYTPEPTPEPEPTIEPTVVPTRVSTVQSTAVPTAVPTVDPTVDPTAASTVQPTAVPTVAPTAASAIQPTVVSTIQPAATEPTATQRPNITPQATSQVTPNATTVATNTPTSISTTTPELPNVTPVPTNAMPSVTPTTEAPNDLPSDDAGGITGRVFVDQNRNSQYDMGETVMPTIVVTLIDYQTQGQTLTKITETDEDGIYSFVNISLADYVVSFDLPPEYNANNNSSFLVRTDNSENMQGPDMGLIQDIELDNTLFLPVITR